MIRLMNIILLLAVMLPVQAADPLEGVNRKVQRFNDFADEKVLRPVAKGYSNVTPDPVKRGINNFFGNLLDIGDAFNNFLQGKPREGASDLARVFVNTTLGLGGLFDPATRAGLRDHNEDFSQTLSVWGVPRGPYLVVPFLGPNYLRDLFARSVDNAVDPLRYYYPVSHRNALYTLELVNQRAGLLSADSVVFGDRYIFFRDAYSQRREYLEKDGKVEDAFDEEF